MALRHAIFHPQLFYQIMKLNIKYDLEKDVENYLRTLYKFDFEKHGRKNIEGQLLADYPPEFREKIKSAKNKEEAEKHIRDYIQNNFAQRTDLQKRIIDDFKDAWNTEGAKLIKKLEDVYGENFPFKEITIYLVSNKRCPYNFKERWIMVYAKSGVKTKLYTLMHELNHFMFYYYFPPKKLEIKSKQEYESLKEALTVLTSPEEQGYPAQQKLRAWLKEQKGTVGEILQNEKWKSLL